MTIIVRPEDWVEDVVTIPVTEYIHLKEEERFLRYLENNDIQEWEKFEACLEAWRHNA